MSDDATPAKVRLTDWLGAYTATASTTQQKTLTLADIERAAQMLSDMQPEPIGEWMRQQGNPPEEWLLILPQRMRDKVAGPMFWPNYVAFSPVLDQQVFLCRAGCTALAPNAEVRGD